MVPTQTHSPLPRNRFRILPLLAVFFSFSTVWAGNAPIPPCMDGSRVLGVMNTQVLLWKKTTANQFKARARVQGVVSRIYADTSSHDHFAIQIGPFATDTIEVIYNREFGPTPVATLGMRVEACGDYITSNAPTQQYQPSPEGAIIHWVHMAPNPKRHDHGYLVMDGQVCGQENPEAPGHRGLESTLDELDWAEAI